MSLLKPRPYQQIHINKAIEALTTSKKTLSRPLFVAPTGSGKSIIIAHIAHVLKKDVLVLQPKKEILLQNYEKFTQGGGEAGLYSASVKTKEIKDVTFATIGSVVRVPELFKHIKYVIIDEAHTVPPENGSMYTNFLHAIGAKTMGVTATPFRNKICTNRHNVFDSWSEVRMMDYGLFGKTKFFTHIGHITQVQEMYKLGFLCKTKQFSTPWNNGLLKKNKTGSEYTKESTQKSFDQNKVNFKIKSIVKNALDKKRKHVLVFVHSVAVAESLAQKSPLYESISAKTKQKERARIIEEFKNGTIKVVFNVGVLTTGFDFPSLDTIIIAKPTMSLSLFLQMFGRGIRPHDSKEYCAVVDMCGNLDRFGNPETLQIKAGIHPMHPLKKPCFYLENQGKILSRVPIKY